ncbi:MAG: hypothetical protein ACRENF_01845, partial [Thermodesulfobacteriota bacterium]
MPKTTGQFKFLPLFVLPTLAFTYLSYFSGWAFMWIMGFSIYLGCKWLTWSKATEKGIRPSIWLSLGYLLAWPGMDAQTFFDRKKSAAKPTWNSWLEAILKTALGAVFL